jgi:pimeloyl-ACP methyl ester carboxylesterase
MLEVMHASEGSIRSNDGVPIGFTRIGQGPALVFVHGSLSDGDDWGKVVSLLAGRFTCYLMDRRGRGRSGDVPEYSIEREYEDVAAVIKHVGLGTSVVAHSFGAICALGAALQIPVGSLVLYEPPIPVIGPVAGAALEEYRAAVDRGALDEALEIGLKRFSRMTYDEIARVRQGRMWMKQRMLSPTWVRELEAIDRHGPSVERYRAIGAPTLLLLGTESTQRRGASEALASVMPAARLELLEGQGHVAHFRAPQEFAKKIVAFLAGQSLQ